MSEGRKPEILFIVVPCYQEEEVLEYTNSELLKKLNDLIRNKVIASESRILYVDDGSRDHTWEKIREYSEKNGQVLGIRFAGNRGHQNAVMAGMMTARNYADMVVTIDADLQQDLDALPKFIDSYYKGHDIVYGVRNDRKTDGFLKRITALGYYKLMRVFGCKMLANSADYRLLSKKALNALSEYQEVHLFLRGLIPLMGFDSDIVYFDVKERAAGESKYTLKKMLTLAVDGITSLSMKPVRIMTFWVGGGVLLTCLGVGIAALIMAAKGLAVPLIMQMLLVTWFMGGVLLVSMGVMGEYIGKVYAEAKGRPRYYISEMVGFPGMNESDMGK